MRELLVLGLFLSLVASAQTPAPKLPLPQFKDVAKEAGLTVSHISTPEKKYIVESMSGGAGLIDCDNDGKLDIITGEWLDHRSFSPGRRSHDHALSSGRRF